MGGKTPLIPLNVFVVWSGTTLLLPDCVVFVVDRVTLGEVFLPVLPFSPVSIIPPVFRTH
jgi:hypothetical protein